MTAQITFYLSRIIGAKLYDADGDSIGRIHDLVISAVHPAAPDDDSFRPMVIGVKTRIDGKLRFLKFRHIEVTRIEKKFIFSCKKQEDLTEKNFENTLLLKKNILDRQIVDINGHKLVRVNDIRLVSIPSGTYAIAVDVGTEGLLRRIGISGVVNKILSITKKHLNADFILWDDVETVDDSNFKIKLSRASNKLHTLHPSDLADIIEEMGKSSRTKVFESLDEEKAADVLEELEPYAQAHIIENLPIEKAADVLEKMPADEVADLLDVLEDDKAQLLLNEMEKESSEEVRDLMQYSSHQVGSIMTTDYLSFRENHTVGQTLNELRKLKPEADMIYSLIVTDNNERLMATVSLRDLVVSEHNVTLDSIMQLDPISVFDDDKIDSLAEIISKYDLLAIPVTNKDMKMEGMVVIDDIVEDLLDRRKTK
ncbi:MAG: CBS domain-containing protein [Bacteroidales bacterium]|jgi:CBS domain-containing protein/sporulation protein YlmC with PRC-barrel domain